MSDEMIVSQSNNKQLIPEKKKGFQLKSWNPFFLNGY